MFPEFPAFPSPPTVVVGAAEDVVVGVATAVVREPPLSLMLVVLLPTLALLVDPTTERVLLPWSSTGAMLAKS
jgi:hypothetical protein